MNIAEFDYDLPAELIASHPLPHRASSRLLVVDVEKQTYTDMQFADILQLLDSRHFLVVNNSKVLKARVPLKKSTGGKSEMFYLRQIDDVHFEALIKGRHKPNDKLYLATAQDIVITLHTQTEDGVWTVSLLSIGVSQDCITDILDKYGEVPLPPYMSRSAEVDDIERYQTVYAKDNLDDGGSVAAPTAGLHFTPELLQQLRKNGVDVLEVTLHVGIGTFRPIKVDNIDEHTMHTETYTISPEVADKINQHLKDGKKLVAVGTTSARTLESAAQLSPYGVKAGTYSTDIFIKPNYQFKVVHSLITNFHQPKSSLLVLVSTLMGHELMKSVYRHAVEDRYRFFSYGDAMYIKMGD